MKKEQLILWTAIVVGIVSTLANLLQFKEVVIVTRLLFLPLIYLYYCFKANKISVFPTLILSLFYATDFFNFCVKDSLMILIYLGIINYLIFLNFGVKDITRFKLTVINVGSFFIIVSFIVFLYVNVLDIALIELSVYKIWISVYGIVLALNAIVAAYNLNYRNRLIDLVYFFCVATFVFTDVSYLISEYYYKFPILMLINYILQLLSYFFIVRYFLLKERYNFKKKALNNN
ncbi:MAG: hypothetical protein JNJ52_08215 [Flavobacterium sp.]|nr:hypothetical protein [Flavobacterium sp.]